MCLLLSRIIDPLTRGTLLGVLLGCGLGVQSSLAGEPAVKEYQLKAAFIYNFTKFIEWPTNVPAVGAPLVLGVAGNRVCAMELQQVVQGRKVNERELLVKNVATPEEAKDVHVLFLGASEDVRLEQWMAVLGGTGVLTVGESEAFIKRGGIINFVLEGEKIRFEINMERAEAAGLRVSAQLQKLAKTVRRRK